MGDPYQIPLGPFGTVPFPRWGVHGIGVLALCAMAVWVYHEAFPAEMLTLKQANAALAREMEEYQQHLGQSPETVFTDPDGSLRVQVYADHAVLILRKDGSRVWTRLVPDLAKPVPQYTRLIPSTTVFAMDECQVRHRHADTPTRRNGESSTCDVPIFWTFADGCTYYQIYNTCRGSFEANGDGSPRIHWVVCK